MTIMVQFLSTFAVLVKILHPRYSHYCKRFCQEENPALLYMCDCNLIINFRRYNKSCKIFNKILIEVFPIFRAKNRNYSGIYIIRRYHYFIPQLLFLDVSTRSCKKILFLCIFLLMYVDDDEAKNIIKKHHTLHGLTFFICIEHLLNLCEQV